MKLYLAENKQEVHINYEYDSRTIEVADVMSLPPAVCKVMDWKEGDGIELTIDGDQITIKKIEKGTGE